MDLTMCVMERCIGLRREGTICKLCQRRGRCCRSELTVGLVRCLRRLVVC